LWAGAGEPFHLSPPFCSHDLKRGDFHWEETTCLCIGAWCRFCDVIAVEADDRGLLRRLANILVLLFSQTPIFTCLELTFKVGPCDRTVFVVTQSLVPYEARSHDDMLVVLVMNCSREEKSIFRGQLSSALQYCSHDYAEIGNGDESLSLGNQICFGDWHSSDELPSHSVP
jgi:hypothetical protein